MKRIIYLFLISAFLFSGCQDDEEILIQETGIVVDYAGVGNCGYVIELDNGGRIVLKTMAWNYDPRK